MTRCPSGHFYDASKGNCPTCARLGQAASPPPKTSPPPGPRTSPIGPRPGESRPIGKTQPAPRPGGTQPGVTIAMWPQELGTDPIVGWLVAFEGKSVGRDYRLRAGRMRIGRADSQDVQIDDDAIHRENHAFIVFDPRSCEFFVAPGDGRELIHLSRNKQAFTAVLAPQALTAFDVLQIGSTKLFFVPFCGKNTFQWQAKGGGPVPDAPTDEPGSKNPSGWTERPHTDEEW